MRLAPFLLRLLLCMSLVANGVGLAHAAAGMQVAHVAKAVAAAVDDRPVAEAGCHEAVPAHAAMTHDNAPAANEPGSHDGACCDGASCECLCTAQVPLACATGLLAGIAPARAVAAAGDASNHRPPRLAHEIRPPIG